eukprot:844594-Pyramimonas_sp.AAC.1
MLPRPVHFPPQEPQLHPAAGLSEHFGFTAQRKDKAPPPASLYLISTRTPCRSSLAAGAARPRPPLLVPLRVA